ncbi:MAG TPA: M48 family metalloprotease [Candidatus Angelobacter sp.]|nr:M48 family metalloprotease [Candidatus Angelobacter sp.]
MKHWTTFGVILLVAAIAVFMVQHDGVETRVSPAPILYFVADTEQELMRVPVTLTRLSDQEEIQIGNEMAEAATSRFSASDTPESQPVAAYVSSVGSKVAQHAQRILPYRFHYIPDDRFINAFALPGGHVFIGKGLLNLMRTEDELASVLGHELEHIDLRHCVERVQIQTQARQIPLGSVAMIPIELFEAGYRKQQELDADRAGTVLAVSAGYSPQGAIDMFQKFQQVQKAVEAPSEPNQRGAVELPIDLANVVVVQTLQEYFRSHPANSERIAQIERLIRMEHWPTNRPQKPLQIAMQKPD